MIAYALHGTVCASDFVKVEGMNSNGANSAAGSLSMSGSFDFFGASRIASSSSSLLEVVPVVEVDPTNSVSCCARCRAGAGARFANLSTAEARDFLRFLSWSRERSSTTAAAEDDDGGFFPPALFARVSRSSIPRTFAVSRAFSTPSQSHFKCVDCM